MESMEVVRELMEMLREDPEVFDRARAMLDLAKRLREDHDLIKVFMEKV